MKSKLAFLIFGLALIGAARAEGPIDESHPDYYLYRYPRLYPSHFGVRTYHSWQDPRNGPFTLYGGSPYRRSTLDNEEWFRDRLLSGKGPGPSPTALPRNRTWTDVIRSHQAEAMREQADRAEPSGGSSVKNTDLPADEITLINSTDQSIYYGMGNSKERFLLESMESFSFSASNQATIRYWVGNSAAKSLVAPNGIYEFTVRPSGQVGLSKQNSDSSDM